MRRHCPLRPSYGAVRSRTEQTKLLATAFNNLGVGSILAGVIAPVVNGSYGDAAHIAFWVALGVNAITAARIWLRRL